MANRVNVDISANVEGFVSGINQATQSAEKYETETKKISDSMGNFRKEFSTTKKEVFNLQSALNKLSAEEKNGQFGKELSKRLQEAKEQMADMIDMQSDLNTELKNMASDTATFDVFADGLSAVGNTMSAVTGTMGIFIGDTKMMTQAVTMFTTAESIASAAIKAKNLLQAQSSLMIGVAKVQTLALTVAENLDTAAKSKNIVVTKLATIAQAAFNKVAMMNPYLLLAAAIAGLGAALYGLISWLDDSSEAEKRLQEQTEKNKKAQEEYTNTVLNAAKSNAEMANNIADLREQYHKTNSELEKTAILEKAAEHFKSLGIECNNLEDAQKILVKNGDKVIKLLDLQGEAAAINALKVEKLTIAMREALAAGTSLGAARELARNSGDYQALVKEQMAIQAQTAELKKQLNVRKAIFNTKSTTSKSSKQTIDFDKGSLEDLTKQLSVLQNKLKKKNLSLVDIEKTKQDIAKLENEIKAKEIKLGIKKPDAKDIEGTEAWYNDQIKKLEEKKNTLRLDAYIERQQLQEQIDGMRLKVKLETEGVTINGKAAISDIMKNNKYEKTIKGTSDAISILQNRLQSTDWSKWQEGQITFDEYVQKIQELKGELSSLQEVYDNAMLTPMERAKKQAEETSAAFQSFSNVAGSLGSIFKQMGEDEAAAMMTIVTSTLDMVAQVIPQIITLIGAKQGEAMASGTASAAKLPFPANLGAIASIVATILSTFASIWGAFKGAEAHANGGVVGGHSYVGDKILARLNSKELVLNQKQQSGLLNRLETQQLAYAPQDINIHGVIRGSDIILVQKNANKIKARTGTSINF